MFRRCKFMGRYTIRCKCFRSASMKNILTIGFNTLMMINALVKQLKEGDHDVLFLQSDLQSDYIDFRDELKSADAIMFFDCLLLLLIIVVISTVVFDWLPEIFNRFLYFVERYANRQVFMIYYISLLIICMLSFLRTIMDGSYLFQVHNFEYALVRNLLVLNGGYFLESNIKVTSQIEESNEELEANTSLAAEIWQHALINILYRFLAFNIFIALMAYYLNDANEQMEYMDKILRARETKSIEFEIRTDHKMAEEAAKKIKF